MNTYLRQLMSKLQCIIRAVVRFWIFVKCLLVEQFNKNIYSRILFTNVTAFLLGLIVLSVFSSYVVESLTYDQLKQDLLLKAKRVNFALLHNNNNIFLNPPSGDYQFQSDQDLIKFLADIYDTRIIVFNMEGKIISTSAEQEVVPGSKIDIDYTKAIKEDEIFFNEKIDRETAQQLFAVAVPMGNSKDASGYGILLEKSSYNINIALNKMNLSLAIGGMVMLVIIIIISVDLAMHISRPIYRLTTTVAEISKGNWHMCAEDQPLDEMNELTCQLNKLTQKMQTIKAESGKMEEERARLFSEISHELRTPLTSIQGFVEAIRDGMVQDEALKEKYLETIYNQTIHITRLVDDMLVLGRLESGNITVEKLPVDLVALTQGVTISLEAEAKKRNTVIFLESKAKNGMVLGDVDRMEQIIRNVLKNAIRATENGTVKVGLETRQEEVVLTIEDNGIGIAPEDLPRIWDRFYRVQNQRGSYIQEKGSGLGLVIVKKLVQLQSGSIDVTSQLGKGTAFTISFPSFEK